MSSQAMTMEKWNEKIDAYIEQEKAKIGSKKPVYRIYCQDKNDRSGGGLYNETVTIDTIGRFARAVGDSNPLYSDPVYAARSARGGIVAPPLLECCICSTFVMGALPRLRGMSVFDAGSRWDRFEEIRPDDRFTAGNTYLGVREISRHPEKSRLLLQEHAISLMNQQGKEAARVTARVMIRLLSPQAQAEGHGGAKAAAEPRPHYSQEQLAALYENLDGQMDGRFRRGAQTLYWEDVQIGDQLPETVVGPYDEADGRSLMAAIGAANAFATKWGSLRHRHPQGVLDPETGAWRDPIDRHSSDTIARAQGSKRAIASGIHSQTLLARAVGDWMGDAGFLVSLDCSCKKPLFYGDLSTQRGTVVNKYEKNGQHYVEMQVEAVRQDGVVHTDALAVVRLPAR